MARAYLTLNFISTNVPGFDLENCFYFFLPLTGYLKSHYFQRNHPFSLMKWFLLKKRKIICKNLWSAAHHILSRKTNSEISRIFTAMGILETPCLKVKMALFLPFIFVFEQGGKIWNTDFIIVCQNLLGLY